MRPEEHQRASSNPSENVRAFEENNGIGVNLHYSSDLPTPYYAKMGFVCERFFRKQKRITPRPYPYHFNPDLNLMIKQDQSWYGVLASRKRSPPNTLF